MSRQKSCSYCMYAICDPAPKGGHFWKPDPGIAPCCTCERNRFIKQDQKVVGDRYKKLEKVEKPALPDSGNRREFETGAQRDMEDGKGRCDLLPACALLRLSRHYEAGARKYSDRNWERGIPISSFLDSGIRHILKYLDGRTDEDHLAAAAWNILGAMWMEEKRPEMQDLDARKGV